MENIKNRKNSKNRKNRKNNKKIILTLSRQLLNVLINVYYYQKT